MNRRLTAWIDCMFPDKKFLDFRLVQVVFKRQQICVLIVKPLEDSEPIKRSC